MADFKALARVVRIWVQGEKTEGDLTVAHTAATFEWGDGPLKWCVSGPWNFA